MKKLIFVVAVVVSLALFPTAAFAHHVGLAEDSMPADQWLFVDSVAHGVSADGGMDMDIAPGAEAGTEAMNGSINWVVSGKANMKTR